MTHPDFWIDRAKPADEPAVEDLLDAAFGADRQAKLSYRYRDKVEPVPELKLVARTAAELVGTVRCWPIAIGSAFAPALLLGPLAVAPAHQGRGIARALMRRVLDLATDAGHNLVLLVGDPAFYRAFGFVPATPHGISMPNEIPARVQIKELVPHALDGVTGTITRWGWVRDSGRAA
ncbi:MAG TPA: N-acetyltransferase [Candidatus Sulfotelmatobacter sp.]|nr:N-acetyltransferase [Candidatus Sulfotelmatobacter sp.]